MTQSRRKSRQSGQELLVDARRELPAVSASPSEDAGVAQRRDDLAGELWPEELTRRLRVLLHTVPLDAVRRGDSLRSEDLKHYDGLALTLRLLDVVIDRLGLEAEADRDVLTRTLRPLLATMDEAAGEPALAERHERMIDRLVSSLRNDGDARRPFREEYTAVNGEGRSERHALEFRLLFDAFHASGRTVLRPSSEACNLYLRLLDIDVEDAQAAAEAVVESQLARGRFDEAVHSARQARIQSVRFREKILQILKDTRRDIDRVDWNEEIPRILNESLAHLERRVSVERGILGAADERLEVISEDDAEARHAVAQVAELTRDSLLKHTELHEDLIGARNVFLDAQGRQSFAPVPSRPLPDLPVDVLEPMLRLPVVEADRLLDRGFPVLVGPRAPILPSLPELVSWMLQPRRPTPRQDVPVDPIDATDLEAELRRFPAEVREAAANLLWESGDGERLSDILARARAAGHSDAVLEALALLALQGFATEDRESIAIAAERVVGARLEDPHLYGDDMLITRTERQR